MGLTSFIIGAFLKNGGYVANVVQTPKALSYIEICFIWIPIVLCVIIAVLTYFYKLDSIRETMTEELDDRRLQIMESLDDNRAKFVSVVCRYV